MTVDKAKYQAYIHAGMSPKEAASLATPSAASLPTSGGLSVFSDVTVTNGSAPVDITWDPTYAFPGAVPPEDLTGMAVNALDNTLIDVVAAGEAFRVSLVSAGVTVVLSAASWMHVTKVA